MATDIILERADRDSKRPSARPPLVLTKRQYLAMRLEEIGVRLAEMMAARGTLTKSLSEGGLAGLAARQARERRAYAAARILALREEKSCLQAEKARTSETEELAGSARNPAMN